MARVILSNHSATPIVEFTNAANVKWRKALNSVGYCEFDLALSDPYATPTYLTAANFVHVYSDSADTTLFANADFGGPLANDFEVKPAEGVISLRGAGMENLLNVSVINQTTIYQNSDVGSIVQDIVTSRNDNHQFLGLTAYTVSTVINTVVLYQINFGENAYNDIETLTTTFNGDFEVRPDWTWAVYERQGVDNTNLVLRYGNQGNMQVKSSFHILNSQLFNHVYVGSDSTSFIANVQDTPSSLQYGHYSEYVSANTNNIITTQDENLMADIELAKHEVPPLMMDGVEVVDSNLLPFSKLHLGDAVWFESSPSANNAVFVPQPLAFYANHVSATTITTARNLVTTSSISATNKYGVQVGNKTGYGEFQVTSGYSWPQSGSIGVQSGQGLLYDTTALEGQQILAGDWRQAVEVLLVTATNPGSITANVTGRYSVYHALANTYTTIGTTTVSAVAISTLTSVYVLPPVTLPAINFNVGDKFYFDLWLDITRNSSGDAGAYLYWGGYGSYTGVGGPNNVLLSPGYVSGNQATDAAAAALPMVQAFNGLQRILTAQYDDRKRTMTLTLGSAIYKIIRGRLSEVRLYS